MPLPLRPTSLVRGVHCCSDGTDQIDVSRPRRKEVSDAAWHSVVQTLNGRHCYRCYLHHRCSDLASCHQLLLLRVKRSTLSGFTAVQDASNCLLYTSDAAKLQHYCIEGCMRQPMESAYMHDVRIGGVTSTTILSVTNVHL